MFFQVSIIGNLDDVPERIFVRLATHDKLLDVSEL
jgi:hypothetical protein